MEPPRRRKTDSGDVSTFFGERESPASNRYTLPQSRSAPSSSSTSMHPDDASGSNHGTLWFGVSSSVVAGVVMVMVGCCINNIALELLVRRDPACGPLVTLLQFLVIAVEGFLQHVQITWRRGASLPVVSLGPRRIPLRHYVAMVVIFWLVSVMNNAALGYHIPMPLHMVFRSGSLVTTILLGYFAFKELFHPAEVLGALLVTAGILLATWATQLGRGAGFFQGGSEDAVDLVEFLIGVFLLSSALCLSSLLGVYQTRIAYAAAAPGEGKPYRENMFYSHLFSIPMFMLLAGNLYEHLLLWNASDPLLFVLGIPIPEMWAYLLLNVATQYVCIRGVFLLTGHLSPLGTTIVITLRKFVSLLISVFIFKNAWSSLHSLGSFLVFFGVFVYAYGSLKKDQAAKSSH